MVQRIVINACHGGFGLSPAAVKRMAELQGKPCYFFTTEPTDLHKHIPIEWPGEKDLFWSAFSVPDPDANRGYGSMAGWHALTLEERRAANEQFRSISLPMRPENRTDPLLLQVVDELGSEKASGFCAKLEIVEVPDGVEWEIEEYDGLEWVAEKHRTWGR